MSVIDWTDESSEYSTVSAIKVKDTTQVSIAPLTKSVRFSENNQVFPVKHLDEFTEEDIQAVWYDVKEYTEIKNNYKLTLYMMDCNKSLPQDHTSRGLEYRTQEGAWARYENKRDAYNAVLDEQDLQWKEDKDDHDMLAYVYLEHTVKSREAARLVGEQDAKAAQGIYTEYYQSPVNESGKSAKRGVWRKSVTSVRHIFSRN